MANVSGKIKNVIHPAHEMIDYIVVAHVGNMDLDAIFNIFDVKDITALIRN